LGEGSDQGGRGLGFVNTPPHKEGRSPVAEGTRLKGGKTATVEKKRESFYYVGGPIADNSQKKKKKGGEVRI